MEEDFPSEAGISAQLVFAVHEDTGSTLSDPAAARAVDAAGAPCAASETPTRQSPHHQI
jgi:hypothetical protein